MKIGLIGPADGDPSRLEEATEFLLGDAGVDQAVYLGVDDAVDRIASAWAKDIGGGETFLDAAARIAVRGSAEDIDGLLEADDQLRRLEAIRTVPAAPARAIEMIDDRIVLMVHDKAILDEEDIANATVIVYGKSPELLVKRFGPRCFFTPGPLRGGKLGLLEVDDEGRVSLAAYEISGAPLWRELLQTRTAKVLVSR